MADRENSMESPAPEEMPLVLAYPADGGPREQSPNVTQRFLYNRKVDSRTIFIECITQLFSIINNLLLFLSLAT